MEFKKLQDRVTYFKDLQCLARSLIDGAPQETSMDIQVIDFDDIYEPTASELAHFRSMIKDKEDKNHEVNEVTICLCTVTCKVSSNCRIKANMFKYIIIGDYIL